MDESFIDADIRPAFGKNTVRSLRCDINISSIDIGTYYNGDATKNTRR